MSRAGFRYLLIWGGLLGAACSPSVRVPTPLVADVGADVDAAPGEVPDTAPADTTVDLQDVDVAVADAVPDVPGVTPDIIDAADIGQDSQDISLPEICNGLYGDIVAPPKLLVADLPECVSCTWKPLPPMHKARDYHEGAWLGDKFYVWGGGSLIGVPCPPAVPAGSGCAEATGESYDPKTNLWTMLPQAPLYPSGMPRVTTDGQRLYVYGDNQYGGPTPWATNPAPVASFDPATATWKALPLENSPGFRSRPAFAWTGNRLLAWGGGLAGPAGKAGPAGAYDPTTDKWMPLPAVPGPAIEGVFSGPGWSGTHLFVLDPPTANDGPWDFGLAFGPADAIWSAFPGRPPLVPPETFIPGGLNWSWYGAVPLSGGFVGRGRHSNKPFRLLRFDFASCTYEWLAMPTMQGGVPVTDTSMHIIGDWLIVLALRGGQDFGGIIYHMPTANWYRLNHPEAGYYRDNYATAVGAERLYLAGGVGSADSPQQWVWMDGWILDGPWNNAGGQP